MEFIKLSTKCLPHKYFTIICSDLKFASYSLTWCQIIQQSKNKFWISGMIHKVASTPYYVDRGTEFIVMKSGSLHIQILVVSIFPSPLRHQSSLKRVLANKQLCFWSNSAFIFPSLRLMLVLCFSVSPSLLAAVFPQQEPQRNRSAFV